MATRLVYAKIGGELLDFWYVFPLIALIFYAWRADLRAKMLWAGVLALPVLFVKPALSEQFLDVVQAEGIVAFFLERAIVSASFGMTAAALYEVVLHKHVTPTKHPLRPWFIFLVIGPVLTIGLTYLAGLPLAISLVIGLTLDVLIVLARRRDLFWDLLFSGFGMAIIYLIAYIATEPAIPGDLQRFWFTDRVLGITLFSVPIEELLVVMLFGALWGPLYVAVKDLRETSFDPHFNLTAISRKLIIGRVLLTVLSFLLVWSANQFLFVPQVVLAHPEQQLSEVGLGSYLRLRFNRPVDRENLKVSFNPPVDVQLTFEDGLLNSHLYTSVVIQPQTYFTPNQEYRLLVENISNVFGIGSEYFEYTFQTQSLPQIARSSVANGQGDVAACSLLEFQLDQPNDQLAEFTFKFDPLVEVNTLYDEVSRLYTIIPKSCLLQSTQYTVNVIRAITLYSGDRQSVSRKSEPETIATIQFQTKAAPGIAAYHPQGNSVLPNESTIRVDFTQPMPPGETEKQIQLTPALPGTWEWESATRLLYRLSQALPLDTTVALTLPRGLKDASNGFFADETVLRFRTIGTVTILETSPRNGGGGINPNASIRITFDQPVDHNSAQSAFSLTPSPEGTFTWQGNVLIFTPAVPFERNTTYRALLKAPIKSVHGRDMAKDYGFSFTTEESVTLLSIAVDYQDKPLSCEVAALKMALRYKGVAVSEDVLMAAVGYDPTVRSGGVWGDPNEAFVGNINGRQNTTGYGVHWAPIARAARAVGRNADAFSGWSVADLARAIANGHPVIIWGVQGAAYYDPWVTPAGKQIAAWKGEHARTVVGFKGSVDNPTQFIINDPIAGRLTWSTAKLRSDWGKFNHSGVVVY